jgi:hypothetical protein
MDIERNAQHWHSLQEKEVLENADASIQQGLTSKEVGKRAIQFGANVILQRHHP